MCVEFNQLRRGKRVPWSVCKPLVTREAREGQVQDQQRIASTVPACDTEEVVEFVSNV